jgi:hypothetical protein
MRSPSKQGRLAIASLAVAVGLAGCGQTTTTNSFTGEQHAVAARISSFQKHVSEANEKKICEQDLASSLVGRIHEAGKREAGGKGCTEVLKELLKDVEDLSLSIQSVTVSGRSASAKVKSVRFGKTHASTVTLVKEGEAWRISGVA